MSDDPFLRSDEPGGMDDVDVWMMATVAMIPMASVVTIIGTYYLNANALGTTEPWVVPVALGAGLFTAVVMLTILYQLYTKLHFNEAKHASVDTYNDLCARMHHVSSFSYQALSGADSVTVEAALAARKTIDDFGLAFKLFRKKRGLHWVLGKGYVDLYRLVHRCEEALIMFEPLDLVLADGTRDLSRIEGSTMPHRENSIQEVNRALVGLDPKTTRYPRARVPDKPQNTSGTRGVMAAETQARQTLRDVRRAIDEFRDASKTRLIEARNNLVARLFLTALSTALLVVFVVVAQPVPYALLAGAVLYSVGAIVGLFGRLYADLRGKSLSGDFGYSHVQLVQTFLVSGLAAVAGVYLAVVLPSQAPRPSDDGSQQVQTVPGVLRIYDLQQYPQGIGVAALFGLAPGLLVSRLSQGVEQYREDLRSSEPTPAPDSAGT